MEQENSKERNQESNDIKSGMLTISKKVAAMAVAGSVALGSGGTIGVRNAVPDAEKPASVENTTSVSIDELKNYTMIFYVVGSDLESVSDESDEEGDGAASDDMAEISAVMKEYALDDTINVVAQIGGTNEWENDSLSEVQNARITIDSHGIQIKEKLADVNMGMSSTVTDFIDYAYSNYPARHYIMIFWNHGNGPAEGFGYDVLHEGDSLTLSELNQSLAEASFSDFDLIGFDACCMGNMETANAMCKYTDYLVASPACEDIHGWDYHWMEIFADENANARNIGEHIVDTYDTFYDNPGEFGIISTLSCYDLSDYDSIYASVQQYNKALLEQADEAFYEQLNSKRKEIAGYYSGGAPNEYMELLDWKQLYLKLDSALWKACELDAALAQLVCHTNVDTAELCGISIYLPEKSDVELAEHMLQYLSCRYDKQYLQFVYNYARMLDRNLEADLTDLETGFDEESMEITFHLDDSLREQIAAAYVMTAFQPDGEGEYCLLSTDSDVYASGEDTLTGILDIKYFAVADQILCLMEQYSGEDRTDYLSPILYNGERCMMTIEVSMDDPDGKIISIIPDSMGGPAGKEQYVLEEGVRFAALYPILTAEGEIVLQESLSEAGYDAGEEVILNEYDCMLDLVDVEFSSCVYGLMMKDKNLGTHYSELREL